MSDTARPGDRLSQWLGLVGLGMVLALVVTLIRTPGADGYEPSLYASYPLYFWALVVAALVIGQLIVLRAALSERPERSNWRLGFLLSLLVVAILVFLPYFRGYPVYGRADVLSHVGYVADIQATGGDPFQNIYQNIHQLVLALSYATGLEPVRVINAVAGVIAVFSIGASYALVSVVFDRRRALLTLPLLIALVGGRAYLNPSPYVQTVLLFPFVLYLFVKTQRLETLPMRLALTAVVISTVIYHPLAALFLVLVFATHYAVSLGIQRDSDGGQPLEISRLTSTNVMTLSVTVFLMWYYNFVGIILRFETVAKRLLRPGSSETKLDSYSSTVSEFSPSIVDIAAFATVRFGQTAVLLAVGSAFTLVALWGVRRDRTIATPYLLTFTLGFVLFSGLGVVFLFVDLIGGFGRPLLVAQFFAALLSGSLLFHLYDRIAWTRGLTVVVAVVLLVGTVLAVGGLYASALSGESNHQVTEQEFDGAAWYFENDLETAPLQEQGIRMYRFEHALNGTESRTVQKEGTALPDHFNYTTHPTLGESYDEDHYYVLTEPGRTFYPTVYPDYADDWRFSPTDYRRLSVDPTVSQVYDNGEFDAYLIESTNGSSSD